MTSFQRVEAKMKQILDNDPRKKQNITYSQIGSQFWITLNRPSKLNAFSTDMYIYLKDLIIRANQILDVKFIIVNGKGGNFSSGNDLKNFIDPRMSEFEGDEKKNSVKVAALILKELCDTIINSKKPIFAIVEGYVVGFAFTQLALYDKVFAVKGAQFSAPLVKIAQGPQMCSSYLFPRIFGKKLASEIIIQGRKVSPEILQKYNFLQLYQNRSKAENALKEHLKYIDSLEWSSYVAARQLMNDPTREKLLDINRRQIQNLVQRWLNPNLAQFLLKYLESNKKSNKK